MSQAPTNPTPTPEPTPTPGADARHAGLASAIRVVSGLTLLSRFAGLARDVITARLFGDGMLGSAFRAGYALPNLFRRLFGEGALSAAFIPQYSRLRRDDPASADELATLVLRLLTLVTGGLTILAMGVLALLIWLLPPDPDRALSFKLMILMLPMMPAVCLTAVLGGMLQTHGRFAPTAAAPVLLNVFQIAAGLLYYQGWITDRTLAAYLVGAAAVLASAAQVAWSWWALRGKIRWAKAGAVALEQGRDLWKRFLPATIGLGTIQLNTMMDMVLSMWPVWVGPTLLGRAIPLDDKSNSILSYTQTIYQFPLGVFGLAVATAVFPMLSRAADKPEEFVAVLRRGLRLSLFIGLPATLGLVLIRADLLEVVFGGGGRHSFSKEGIARAGDVLLGFSIGVWAYSLNHVFTRAFYAHRDTSTPMRVALATVLLNFTLNLTLIWWWREAGMAWATGIAAIVQCVVLGVLCRRRLEVHPMNRSTWIAFARMTALSVLMGAGVWGTLHVIPDAGTWRSHLVRTIAATAAGGGLYALLAWVTRTPELGWLLARGAGRAPGDGPTGGLSLE